MAQLATRLGPAFDRAKLAHLCRSVSQNALSNLQSKPKSCVIAEYRNHASPQAKLTSGTEITGLPTVEWRDRNRAGNLTPDLAFGCARLAPGSVIAG
jgi:hypothetical protein